MCYIVCLLYFNVDFSGGSRTFPGGGGNNSSPPNLHLGISLNHIKLLRKILVTFFIYNKHNHGRRKREKTPQVILLCLKLMLENHILK